MAKSKQLDTFQRTLLAEALEMWIRANETHMHQSVTDEMNKLAEWVPWKADKIVMHDDHGML